jgi:hypothetical protein
MAHLSARCLTSLLTLGLVGSMTPVHAPAAVTDASAAHARATMHQGTCRVGDKVEAYDGGWYNATVTQIGTGRNAGDCLVHHDNFSTDRWIKASSLRPRQGTDTSPTKADDASAATRWQPGDKVLAWNVTWYPATVLGIGTGQHAGDILVHYDAYSSASDRYVRATNVKARPDARAVAARAAAWRAAGPRVGRYRILSYGGSSPLHLGEVELLAGGRYRVTLPGGRVNGEGRYAYDPATATVRWLSGRSKDEGWDGGFTVERDGKTHQVGLRSGTIAVNSTDAWARSASHRATPHPVVSSHGLWMIPERESGGAPVSVPCPGAGRSPTAAGK